MSTATKNGSRKAPAAPPPEPPKQRPAHEIRLGRIKATIWANHNENGTWFNVTLSRNYKDGEEWKSSPSFGRDELLTVAKVADLANSWIHDQARPPTNDGHDDGNSYAEPDGDIPF